MSLFDGSPPAERDRVFRHGSGPMGDKTWEWNKAVPETDSKDIQLVLLDPPNCDPSGWIGPDGKFYFSIIAEGHYSTAQGLAVGQGRILPTKTLNNIPTYFGPLFQNAEDERRAHFDAMIAAGWLMFNTRVAGPEYAEVYPIKTHPTAAQKVAIEKIMGPFALPNRQKRRDSQAANHKHHRKQGHVRKFHTHPHFSSVWFWSNGDDIPF